MLGFAGFCLIFTIIQNVASEMPEQCRKLPPELTNPEDCCDIPKMFSAEDMKDCNVNTPYKDRFKTFAADCSKVQCILKKHNLLQEDGNTDKEALAVYIDKWGESNTDFKDAIDKLKSRCLDAELPGPPEVCVPQKIAFCVRTTLLQECPYWQENDDCKKTQDFISGCKTFLPFS